VVVVAAFIYTKKIVEKCTNPLLFLISILNNNNVQKKRKNALGEESKT